MTYLLTAETLVLALLSLLVAGLLRSHAEILRRLAELDRSPGATGGAMVDPALPPPREGTTPAFDIVGTTLAGDPVKVAVTGRQDTLVAFLSSGCLSCRKLWQDLHGRAGRAVPGGARLVVVTKDRSHESPTKLMELAPPDVPVVMSSAAWEGYGVQGSPYFILVGGESGEIEGEGTAGSWEQVSSLLRDAIADQRLQDGRSGRPALVGEGEADGSAVRIRRADEELAAAGILPGHPSLWRSAVTRGDVDGRR
jgi:hypothetical protein